MSQYLIHSSGPWKDHEYSTRTGSKNEYHYTYPQSILDKYATNRARKSGKKSTKKSSKSSKSKSKAKSKFFRYVGGNFNKYFQQNYQGSDNELAKKLYSEAGQADALMKRINEGRSTNVEADLIAVRNHLDAINKMGSAQDKEGSARMAAEFMHDIQEMDSDNAKKYSKILGTGTYDLDADEKNARGVKSTKKKSTKKKSTRKRKSKKTLSHSAFADPLDYKYSIRL